MRRLLVFMAALAVGAAALAHEGDVVVEVSGSGLYVPTTDEGFFVYEGEFPFPGTLIDEPGFAAEGTLQDGDLLGFNVQQALLYWDGAALASVPTDHNIALTHPSGNPALGQVIIDGSSGLQDGFNFAQADETGSLDEHLLIELGAPGAPEIGAYGVWLRLTSPSYDESNDFVILLNYGLSPDEFEAGVEEIGSIVPEPSSLLLLGLSALGATVRDRRSRKS